MSAFDLVMYRGDDRAFTFTLREGITPIDLTGASVRFTAKRHVRDVTPLFALTSGVEITIDNDPTTGRVVIAIPAAATNDLVAETRLYWDLEITDGAGNVRTLPDPDARQVTLGTLLVRLDLSRGA